MVYFTEKKIKGKKYLYAVHSVRLSDGKILKIAKRVHKRQISRGLLDYFEVRGAQQRAKNAVGRFKADLIFTKEQIAKLEESKEKYRKILKKLTRKQQQDLFDRFTVNFTYESNAIEGNSLTLRDVAIVLFEGRVVRGKSLREIYETKNSRKVVDMVLHKKFGTSEEDIIKMHKILVKEMEIETGYKKIPNYLLGRNVETAPPESVSGEIRSLLGWIESENRMHPLQKAAHFHARFEKIHPFDDGNGRVGRFIINVMLVNSGYAPLIIRKTQRVAYLKCLQDYDNGYTKNLERFILEKYKKTFKQFFEVYVKYVT